MAAGGDKVKDCNGRYRMNLVPRVGEKKKVARTKSAADRGRRRMAKRPSLPGSRRGGFRVRGGGKSMTPSARRCSKKKGSIRRRWQKTGARSQKEQEGGRLPFLRRGRR